VNRSAPGGPLASVTPSAESAARACFRLLCQLELERLPQSHLLGVLLQHHEEGSGFVGADRQVDPVSVDGEPDSFGEAVVLPETQRDLRGCVVGEVDAEDEHRLVHDFAVERVRDAVLSLWEAHVSASEREVDARVRYLGNEVGGADFVVVVWAVIVPDEDAGDTHGSLSLGVVGVFPTGCSLSWFRGSVPDQGVAKPLEAGGGRFQRGSDDVAVVFAERDALLAAGESCEQVAGGFELVAVHELVRELGDERARHPDAVDLNHDCLGTS